MDEGWQAMDLQKSAGAAGIGFARRQRRLLGVGFAKGWGCWVAVLRGGGSFCLAVLRVGFVVLWE
jgi:hypothetical protein